MKGPSRFACSCILALSCVAFALGLLGLLLRRVELGDSYGEYSSYRSGPIGTSVLYEALKRMPGRTVSRFLQRLDWLEPATGRLLVVPGLGDGGGFLKEIDEFVDKGGSALLMFNGIGRGARRELKLEPFGLELVLGGQDEEVDTAELAAEEGGLPRNIPWRHGGVFSGGEDGRWECIYKAGGRPVLLRSRANENGGRLILCSSTYLFSNEALAASSGRNGELVAWCLGDADDVVFFERHLGSHGSQGIVSLLRMSGMHSVAVSFVLAFLLFIWNQSSAAGQAAAPAVDSASSMNAIDGLAEMLRRSIPRRNLAKACADEWLKDARGLCPEERIRAFREEAGKMAPGDQFPGQYEKLRDTIKIRNRHG